MTYLNTGVVSINDFWNSFIPSVSLSLSSDLGYGIGQGLVESFIQAIGLGVISSGEAMIDLERIHEEAVDLIVEFLSLICCQYSW